MAEPFNLGEKLRRIRLGQGLTLRELARKARCSPSFISQIELNQASPTVANLGRICVALRLAISDFLQDEETLHSAVTLLRVDERPLAMRWSGARLNHLVPRGVLPPFSSAILSLESQGVTPPRKARRSYNELALVLMGVVDFCSEREVITLEPNQSIYYDLGQEHFWRNLGTEPAQILLVNGCKFSLFEQEEEDLLWDKRKAQERKASRLKLAVKQTADAPANV